MDISSKEGMLEAINYLQNEYEGSLDDEAKLIKKMFSKMEDMIKRDTIIVNVSGLKDTTSADDTISFKLEQNYTYPWMNVKDECGCSLEDINTRATPQAYNIKLDNNK